MGSAADVSYPEDGEAPVHVVEISAFAIDPYTVTNDRYAAFVDATGYVTDAERFGWSYVFGGFLPDDFPDTRAVAAAPWWRQVYEADWRRPEGPHSDLDGRGDHPVVHVSWNDAAVYCAWSGTRLPSEAEWEYAACAGRGGMPFPWGEELEPGGQHLMNVFQGTFPSDNTLGDGYAGTAPVEAFPPNGYGLYNMTGNVWEWCADWYDPATYQHRAPRDPDRSLHGNAPGHARRLLPVPRLVLPPLPRDRSQRQHPRRLDRQPGLQGGAVAVDRRASGEVEHLVEAGHLEGPPQPGWAPGQLERAAGRGHLV